MDSKSDLMENGNLEMSCDWKNDKKQLVIDAVSNAKCGNPVLNFKKMVKTKYEKEYEKYRRYKKYKRKHKDLKDLGMEWEKCLEAEKKRKEEEETRRKYMYGGSHVSELKKKMSSQHSKVAENSSSYKKQHKDKKDRKPDNEADKDKSKDTTKQHIDKKRDHYKDKEREKAVGPQIKRERDLPLDPIKRERELPLDNKPYTSSFKALIKENKITSREKRPLEKYVNKTKPKLDATNKSSREKPKKEMRAADVMKEMFRASKIGEQVSGPSFKIPKKSEPSIVSKVERDAASHLSAEKVKTYKRIHDPVTPTKSGVSPPRSPSSSGSDISSPGSVLSEMSISSPDMYKDLSPLPLPNSPPASPDKLTSGVEESSVDGHEVPSTDLSKDIKPIVIQNLLGKDELVDTQIDQAYLRDEKVECTMLDAPGDINKYFCQLCDMFDKEGTTKTKIVLHILDGHLQGFSNELELCQTVEEKIQVFTSDSYATMIRDCGVDEGLYQPVDVLNENITRWKCLRCPKTVVFKIEREAERHVAMEHYGRLLVPPELFINTGFKIFECSQLGCERRYESWKCVINHEVLQHDALKGYLGKVFKNDYLLKSNIPKKRLRQ